MSHSLTARLQSVARPDTATRSTSVVVVLASLTMVMSLQSQRVFVPTMIFVVDQSNRTQLILNAAVVFLAIGLIGVISALAGLRSAALVGAGLLAASRLTIQFANDPQVRWMVAAAGVVASGWLLVLLVATNRQATALAIPAAFWLDLTLRTLFETIDLAYMTTNQKDVIAIVLVVAVLLLAALMQWPDHAREQNWAASISLLGLGPGLTAYALVSGNLGLAAVMTSNDLHLNYWLLTIGPLLAFAFWSAPRDSRWLARLTGNRQWPVIVLLAALGGIGLAGIWVQIEQDVLAGIALLLFSTASMILMMTSVAGPGIPRTQQGITRTTTMVTAGLCLHATLVFLYFASSGSFLFLGICFVVIVASASSVAWGDAPGLPSFQPLFSLSTARRILLVMTIGIGLVMSYVAPGERFTTVLDDEITVVTYNIQNGFSRDDVWDLEATARTIESFEPDIVLLQESGRGWFAMGWADQVWWLSDRLGMDFVFGPASEDNLWGNAILSAAHLGDPELLKFSSTQNLNRSVVSAEVEVPGGTLWVASTHLDNPSGATEVRLEQTTQLLEFWNGTTPAVVGGDFNAQPDSEVVTAMLEAGFVDAAAAAGNPPPTSENGNRIDYLFVTSGLEVAAADAPDIWTSDHRPLQVDLTLHIQ